MEGIKLLRDANAQNSARRVGLRTQQPRRTLSQTRVAFNESDILALPLDIRAFVPLQDLDPDSPTFGQFYALADVDMAAGDEDTEAGTAIAGE